MTAKNSKQTAWLKRKTSVENKVLARIKDEGGFSVFWATQSIEIARAIDRLQRDERIAPKRGKAYGNFPWCGYSVL